MKEGGFRLHKWKKNEKDLGEQITATERHAGREATENSGDGCSYAKETLGMSSNMRGNTKVLESLGTVTRTRLNLILGEQRKPHQKFSLSVGY